MEGRGPGGHRSDSAYQSGRCWFEAEGRAVHAIAQARRFRAVVEDVAEMAAAAAAMHGRSRHEKARIAGLADRAIERRPKTRPAGMAVELHRRGEKIEGAADAGENAGAVFIEQRAGARPFGSALAQH